MDYIEHKSTDRRFYPEMEDVRGKFYKLVHNRQNLVMHSPKEFLIARLAKVLDVPESELQARDYGDGLDIVG